MTPSAATSWQISIASSPFVRNRRSSGSPARRDLTGSVTCSSGIHCRNPTSACPVSSRTSDACTVLIPFATPSAHPMCWRLTPAVHSPFFSCPVSSRASTVSRPFRRPCFRAADSSPDAANLRTTLIAAAVSQTARLSRRCVLSGVLSPTNFAIAHPFRSFRSLISAFTYFPACVNTSPRAKHERSAPSSSSRSRPAVRTPMLAAAAASDFVVLTST